MKRNVLSITLLCLCAVVPAAAKKDGGTTADRMVKVEQQMAATQKAMKDLMDLQAALQRQAEEEEAAAKALADSLANAPLSDIPATPSYVLAEENWDAMWFAEAGVGFSSFVCDPMGCADMFGHMNPLISVHAGKWFTPRFGARLSYEGYRLKACNMSLQSYQSWHGDFLWSPMGQIVEPVGRFDFVTILGFGWCYNPRWDCAPFAFSYGIQGRYKIAERLHLTATLSGTTTSSEFDGFGRAKRYGDNFFDLALGVSCILGKPQWKGVPDAETSRRQAEALNDRCNRLAAELDSLRNRKVEQAFVTVIPQQQMAAPVIDSHRTAAVPVEDCGQDQCLAKVKADEVVPSTPQIEDEPSDIPFPPFCFFFRTGTSKLINPSQMDNLEAIADYAMANRMVIHVIGCADADTGTEKGNKKLARDRARVIANELHRLGVAWGRMKLTHEVNYADDPQSERRTRIEMTKR